MVDPGSHWNRERLCQLLDLEDIWKTANIALQICEGIYVTQLKQKKRGQKGQSQKRKGMMTSTKMEKIMYKPLHGQFLRIVDQ